MKYVFKPLRNLKRNKKGSLAIEIVIGMFIFLIAMSFLVDLTTIAVKFFTVTQSNSYVARTVGMQGGVSPNAPLGFPGGNTQYITSAELYSDIKENLNNVGIEDSDWTVRINGINLTPSTNIQVDYRGQLSTEMVIGYRWSLVSNFIPGNITNDLTSRRVVNSEFKYRYDNWIGE